MVTFLPIVLNFVEKQRTAGYGSGKQNVQGGFDHELAIKLCYIGSLHSGALGNETHIK